MTKTITVEHWFAFDKDGDYGHGVEKDDAADSYTSDYGNREDIVQYVRFVFDVDIVDNVATIKTRAPQVPQGDVSMRTSSSERD